MGPVLLDTGVVIAAIEASDAHHDEAARIITGLRRDGARLMVSAVTITELFATRGRGRSARVARSREFVASLGSGAVVALDQSTAEIAGDLRSAHRSLGLGDALIKASAESAGAERLLTTDRALARLDGAQYVGASRRG